MKSVFPALGRRPAILKGKYSLGEAESRIENYGGKERRKDEI